MFKKYFTTYNNKNPSYEGFLVHLMKTFMKTVISTGVFLSLVFASCKSHDSAPSRLYHITKSIYNDQNGVATDSAKFTYDSINLSRVDVSGDKDYYATFEYRSGLITKKNIFYSSASTTADEYINVTYSGSSITLMEHYTKTGSNYVKDKVYTLSYNGTQLSRIVIANNKNSLFNNVYQYDYTYRNNNVEIVKSTDFDNNFNNETITFAYDSNKNYYNK